MSLEWSQDWIYTSIPPFWLNGCINSVLGQNFPCICGFQQVKTYGGKWKRAVCNRKLLHQRSLITKGICLQNIHPWIIIIMLILLGVLKKWFDAFILGAFLCCNILFVNEKCPHFLQNQYIETFKNIDFSLMKSVQYRSMVKRPSSNW